MTTNQTIDLALVEAYLRNLQLALVIDQPQHAELLLAHALQLMAPALTGQHPAFLPTDLPIEFSAGVGLDTGKKKWGKPNEDFVFAAEGTIAATQEPFGLFVVADGLGGQGNGQEASRLAIETIVDSVLPQIREAKGGTSWGELLRHGVEQANNVVYQRNQQLAGTSMATTITAALIVGPEVFVANVGDSRTYLYRPGQGLVQLTRDHSTVARLVETGAITRDEIYSHPQRNEIYRTVGTKPSVEVDVFRETLQDDAVLLLCSDGLWEMVPDEQQLADVLSSSWESAGSMAEKLVQLALAAGGLDNIGLVVVRVCIEDITGLQTIITPGQGILLSA